MSFKNFLQNGPINEGLFSNLFGNGKKKPERPQTAVGKNKDAYRTHDDIDPDDVPVFKPSFTVKKEDEEIEESRARLDRKSPGFRAKVNYTNSRSRKEIVKGTAVGTYGNEVKKTPKLKYLTKQHNDRVDKKNLGEGKDPLVNRKIKKASITSSKTGKFAKVDHYVKSNDERNITYTTKNFKKKTVKEEVSPLLKVKHLGARLDEGRARLSKDSKMNDGKNRKVRKAQKQAADTNVNLGHNFLAKVSYQRKRQKARERNSPRMTQNTGSVN